MMTNSHVGSAWPAVRRSLAHAKSHRVPKECEGVLSLRKNQMPQNDHWGMTAKGQHRELTASGNGAVQYGLIAEEVDKVYPELVIHDAAGQIQSVRYDELAPMLLNEVQHQAAEIREFKQQHEQKAAAQDAEIRDLKKLVVEMQAGLLKLQAKEELVAQR
jgi:hypothetical protein